MEFVIANAKLATLAKDVDLQQSHAAKRLLPLLCVNIWRFVAMLPLRNKDQQ